MPKRGGLKSTGKRQESATFLQRSFFDVAVQFFVCCSAASGPNDFRTAEKPMLQCSFCSAALRKLQSNFRFRFWHVPGVGFRGVGLGLAEKPKTQIFAENRRFSQIHPFSWKFKHLEGTGNRRKPQIFAGNRRFSQKTAGNRRLGSVTLGPLPLAWRYFRGVSGYFQAVTPMPFLGMFLGPFEGVGAGQVGLEVGQGLDRLHSQSFQRGMVRSVDMTMSCSQWHTCTSK